MMSCSRACVLSSPRALVLSCSHAFMLSGSPAVMPSCYRATKRSYRKESGNALLLFLWLLVSSSLTPSPALSSSQAKEYAPSVTRFPFLLVQVFASAERSGFQKSCSRRGGAPIFENKGPLRPLDLRDLSKSSKMRENERKRDTKMRNMFF